MFSLSHSKKTGVGLSKSKPAFIENIGVSPTPQSKKFNWDKFVDAGDSIANTIDNVSNSVGNFQLPQAQVNFGVSKQIYWLGAALIIVLLKPWKWFSKRRK
jgi:hypothetical protein